MHELFGDDVRGHIQPGVKLQSLPSAKAAQTIKAVIRSRFHRAAPSKASSFQPVSYPAPIEVRAYSVQRLYRNSGPAIVNQFLMHWR